MSTPESTELRQVGWSCMTWCPLLTGLPAALAGEYRRSLLASRKLKIFWGP